MAELEKAYDPKGIEEKWYQEWLQKGYFSPETGPGKPYSIVIPPPNVTGTLHMGHALNATLQDILIRWKRMLGFQVLWLPGTDHAGIATQNVVERELAKEGLDRHKIGREAFNQRVWKWKAEYGDRIIHQLKKLGASCDWSRERFTLDEGLSRAVRKVFVSLYEEGLIYRDNRLINWCPRCQTALSDLEVEHEELEGLLTYIKYPLTDGSAYIIVATTRPETLLGDTAVAVNPEDDRYSALIGKTINLPLTDRSIYIIPDSAVDKDFGTGAVKVTPAHDFNDEAIAKRQVPQLPSLSVIDKTGRMSEAAGSRYAGLDRYECRKRVVTDLEEVGLLVREETYKHSVGHCYRCKTVIEPISTPQWYVNVKPLAVEAIKAVREGNIRILPGTWENSYYAWMENIRDWCISRQIWWGHRIPVWTCDKCGEVNVAAETPQACKKCDSASLSQDEDVLDTWFSSALWPFSTMGWPDQTEDLKTFYPTNALVTGFDILFFWVARMIMMGLKTMEAVPFRDVYIHALVRDSKGQKMSKSKGNVIDPLTIIDKHGADAFRFSLAAFAAQGRDIKFSEDRVEGYRYFVNKLWNATRFILMHATTSDSSHKAIIHPVTGGLIIEDTAGRWILSRLAAAVDEVNKALEDYRFNDAASSIYQFAWHEFCDWYIEMSKSAIYDKTENKPETLACLIYVLEHSLRLLHPFMPFATEELWQHIKVFVPGSGATIMKSAFPTSLPRDLRAEEEISCVMDAVTSIRNIRGELNVSPAVEIAVFIKTFNDKTESILKANIKFIRNLAKAGDVRTGSEIEKPKGSATALRSAFEVYVPLKGLLNIEAEIERLARDTLKVNEALTFLSKKLQNEDFLKRAPKDIIEKEKAKYEELILREERLGKTIKKLKEMGTENA